MSEPKKEFEKHFRILNEKIDRFLSKDKPVDVLIIKAHLICEYYLNQILILKNLCTANQVHRLRFHEKIEKSFNKEISTEKRIYDSLHKLNQLRNKVGHELEYVLAESDVDNLGYIRGQSYILNKYDFENLNDLLHDTLETIVIDVAMHVYIMVDTMKKEKETT